MVMENEIRLGDIMDKLTPSDRVVIYNAARQVVYRGYAANAVYGTLNPQRRIKKMGLGMETYRATEQIITTPEVVEEDGSRRKGSGTAEDKATMQSAVPGAGIRHGRRGNSW